MKISTILDYIDNGHMALPEFQRGYVWNRDQVRGLMDSLYRRHPIGGLLVWTTESKGAQFRGDGTLTPGVVKLLLDGQQRMTTVYGIVRGKPPQFFDGNAETFNGLYFHVDSEEFRFHQPIKMKSDPLWIDVTRLMQEGIGPFLTALDRIPESRPKITDYVNRLNAIHSIQTIEVYVEEVAGADKTIDVVVDIFNQVNSGGTKLSKGDLALAKICAEWAAARDTMKASIEKWREAGYRFNLDWLLRNVNTVTTGEALFGALHDVSVNIIDYLLNVVAGRLGLDHDRVLFGRYAFPVMARYVDRRGGKLPDGEERDHLLFWYVHSAMWGRFSGSTETVINRDLELIEGRDDAIERLIGAIRLERGDLRVRPGHFGGWSLGARFYPMLYLLTRKGEAKDWGTGLPLKSELLGKLSRLEVHHIFPRSLLYKEGHRRPDVNAVANYCFLTQETNIAISAKPPEVYFEEIEENHPGALASQWIPMDQILWKPDYYLDFLEARRELLSGAANALLDDLYPQQAELETIEAAEGLVLTTEEPAPAVPGGVDDEKEERVLLECRDWITAQGLPEAEYEYELTDAKTGEPLAILDLAWPNGLQEGLSEPVAVLISEGPDTLNAANIAGYRYFTDVTAFKHYVQHDVLTLEDA
ncbi:MAG: DUF262 domain-containing protein [Rhodospirillaceae bacterium]|nr:DUF262 domain-containing protein [Rhodospirillaceae bacterium]